MSECTNETLEYCILNDRYKPTDKEVQEMAKDLLDLKLKEKNASS